MQKKSPKIKSIRTFERKIELNAPYVLSFVTLNTFDSNFIEVELDNGGIGLGEATALPGYGEETAESIDRVLKTACSQLKGMDIDSARNLVSTLYPDYPFAASAIGTALDLAEGAVSIPEQIRIPLLTPISASLDIQKLQAMIDQAQAQGYHTVKVKVGKNIEADLVTARTLLETPCGLRYRFDANQAYSADQARRFLDLVAEIGSDQFEYLEQPLPINAWKEAGELCKRYAGYIMLDESIYDRQDVKRAADIGAAFIKLKLFKTKGLLDLLETSRYARSLGLEVVLGNGVATDVCNLAEAAAFSLDKGLYYGACEGNGFLKLKKRVLSPSLKFDRGHLVFSHTGYNLKI